MEILNARWNRWRRSRRSHFVLVPIYSSGSTITAKGLAKCDYRMRSVYVLRTRDLW